MKEKSGSEEKKPAARNYMIVGKDFNRKKPVIITESNINQFLFPGCCHPIPGDDALGFIDGRHRIEIHKRNCPVASKLKSSYGNRILDAKWDMHKTMFFDATIEISGIDRMGLLKEVTQVICDRMNVNIRKVVISSNQGIFDGSIELRVHDREDVRLIMDELKIIDGLQEINQII